MQNQDYENNQTDIWRKKKLNAILLSIEKISYNVMLVILTFTQLSLGPCKVGGAHYAPSFKLKDVGDIRV